MSATVDALAPQEEEVDAHFDPVIKLERVETKTNEEDEDVVFKIRAKLFRLAAETKEWKERGTGDVRLLAHKTTKKVRLVMRREKTLKVCANHAITLDMRLQPNIGSDRSWVWKVAADYAEYPPTSETLAIRFANPENANIFKAYFDKAREANAVIAEAAVKPKPAEPSAPATADTSATVADAPATVADAPATVADAPATEAPATDTPARATTTPEAEKEAPSKEAEDVDHQPHTDQGN